MASGSGNTLPVEDICQLLESSDTAQNIREAILDNLQSTKETWLIHLLVDYYFKTGSSNVKDILSEIREPHAKVLLEKLQEGVKCQDTRLSSLQLILHLVYKEMPWCHQILEMSLFSSILKCLKNEHDVTIIVVCLMIIAILMPTIPVSIGKFLPQIFEIFGRLTLFCIRKPAGQAVNTPELFLLQLQVALYSLFTRLYGMYPRAFLDFIAKFYSQKENLMAYEEVVMPMLERVRLHPNIVMSQGQNEMSANRWKHQETQDIVVNCCKLSLDLTEGSLEETRCPIYQPVHDVVNKCPSLMAGEMDTNRASAPVSVPMAKDTHSDSQLLVPWVEGAVVLGESPSVLIGLSTPPSSHRATPAISFTETHLVGGASNETPENMSHQTTPLCGGGGAEESEKTPLSSNRSSLGQNLSRLGDSGKKSSVVTPKAVTTAPNTTPVNTAAYSGGPFLSPGPFLSMADTTSPLKSQTSAFVSPKLSRSPAIRSIQFANEESPTKPKEIQVCPNKDKETSATVERPEAEVEPKSKDDDCRDDPDDQEVEEINEKEDQFDTGGSPTSSISTQASQTEVTAESVRQFMKKVNRIRFNSLTSTSSGEYDIVLTAGATEADIQRRIRPRSCPPLRRKGLKWSLSEEGLKDRGRNRTRARKTWKQSEEDKGCEADKETMTGPSEESSEENSSGSGCGRASIPKVVLMRSNSDRHKPRPMQDASTEMVPPFPGEINPAFQMMFAPCKLAVCNSCHSDLVVTAAHPKPETASGIVTTIKSTEISFFSALSPTELLDRHLKLGSDLHLKELTMIPLPSKDSISWTHFGGVPPADEVNILKGQIQMMHAQLLYERHKRCNHAKRNRRLLRRIAHEAKLEEQQKTLTDQIRLLEQEVQQLSVSIKLVQGDNCRLRQTQESDQYSQLVQFRATVQECKDLKASNMELKNLLLSQTEEYGKLQKSLEHVEHLNLEYEQELKICRLELGNTDKLKGQVFSLKKELLLMQELHQKYQEKLNHCQPTRQHKAEEAMLISSFKRQLDEATEEVRVKGNLLEAYKAGTEEFENRMDKKDKAIERLKSENHKTRAFFAEKMTILEDRIKGLIHSNHQLESEILNLVCQLDQRKHKEMIQALKENTARSRPPSATTQQALENPAKLEGVSSTESPLLAASRNSSVSPNSGGKSVSVVVAKDEVSAHASTFNQNDRGEAFPGRKSSSLLSRADTEVCSDSGADSRSSFRVDSDVSMKSVSGDSITTADSGATADSGCWPKT